MFLQHSTVDCMYICHCGLVDNTHNWKHRGPRYKQIHRGLDDHLKWRSSVIRLYPQWHVTNTSGALINGPP